MYDKDNDDIPLDLTALAKEAMLEKGMLPDFSLQVWQELKKIEKMPLIPADFNALDMRSLLWFSLDNDTSKDLDQLTFAKKLKDKDDKYVIYIAVALVDMLVKKGGAIDAHAAQNTVSIYAPTKMFPMLPEKLSTDLTSLNENEERLALIFEAEIDNDGLILSGRPYVAIVHNKAQLAYNSVSDWLDGKAAAPLKIQQVPGLDAQIKLQDQISSLLENARHQSGALSLETIEPHIVLIDGKPVEIKKESKNRGKELIENFMIVANTISARYADTNKLLSLRRVVTIPERWDKIVEIAAEKGVNLPKTPNAKALQLFLALQKKKDPDSFPDLSLTIVKLLGRGKYTVIAPNGNSGENSSIHFGLGLQNYSHSTAPNRRFPDLLTQRILLSSLYKQRLPYSKEELQSLATHCTKAQEVADKIERRLKKCAQALVISKHIGDEFDAIVTGAGNKGTWVRTFSPPVEGKIIKGEGGLDVGDKIRVKLISTNPRAGHIDFIKD